MYVGLGPVVARARVLVHEVLDRGAHAVFRGCACYASQVLDRGAQADPRGAAQVLRRCAEAVVRGAARFACRYLIVVLGPKLTAHLIAVHSPVPTAPLVVRRRS